MRVLLDTNVILDALLRRPPWHEAAVAIIEATEQHRLTCAATTLSVANLFYIGRRLVGLAKARSGMETCLKVFEIVSVDRATSDAALLLPGSDFEDNIHIAAAAAGGMDAIVTRDSVGFAQSPVRVLTPNELLASLEESPSSG
jgi:predicted nucleic acid-binding protein